MGYLLDVNVLIAWGWSDHSEHHRAASWIGAMVATHNVTLYSSSIPELGFIRVSIQRTAGRLTVEDAAETLAGMLGSLGITHKFLVDDRSSVTGWPQWCQAASRTTDAHLLGLATKHGLALATLDEGVPGAYLIPIP